MKIGVDYIGVTCVFYCHDGKGNFLLHKRSKKCRDERGRWDCGGGAMRTGETFEKAVQREVKEEYCCKALDLKLVGANNVLRKNGSEKTHWIAILFSVRVDPREVRIGEPKKMDEIGWFSPKEFPVPLHSMFLEHFDFLKRAAII